MIAEAHPVPADRARATGVWGASIGAGIAIGPLLGNYLGLLHSWRDVYVVLGVAGLVLAVAARRCPESRSPDRARLDVAGVVSDGVGNGCRPGRAHRGSRRLERVAAPVLLLAAGLALLVGFLLVERRSTHPMLDLGLLKRPAFRAVNLAGLATGAGIIALMSYVSGFVGAGLGISATTAAWLMLAWSAPSVVTAVAARRLPAAWTGRGQMAGALLVIAIGQLLVLGVDTGSGPARFLPGLLVAGVATGVLNAAMGRESVGQRPAGPGRSGQRRQQHRPLPRLRPRRHRGLGRRRSGRCGDRPGAGRRVAPRRDRHSGRLAAGRRRGGAPRGAGSAGVAAPSVSRPTRR